MFQNDHNIREVVLPEGIRRIGEGCFEGCSRLCREPGVHSETYLCGMRIYHEVSGTLGIPMSVTVIDPDTNM